MFGAFVLSEPMLGGGDVVTQMNSRYPLLVLIIGRQRGPIGLQRKHDQQEKA